MRYLLIRQIHPKHLQLLWMHDAPGNPLSREGYKVKDNVIIGIYTVLAIVIWVVHGSIPG